MKKLCIIVLFLLIQSCQNKSGIIFQKSIEKEFINLEKLDKFTNKNPGIAVLVIKNNETIIKKGYGCANLKEKKDINEETIFEIGSITKMFTASAILKLENDKRIDILKPAINYLPKEYAFIGNKIKVKDLIFHTSTLPDYLNDKSINLHEKVNSNQKIGNDYVLQYLKDRKKDLKSKNPKTKIIPGKEFSYSNTNYVLLSLIIEDITKMPYPQYMKNFIFTPASMKTAIINEDKRQINPHESKAYSEWPLFEELSNKMNYITTGDFGLQLSLNDFEGWIKMLKENQNLLAKYKQKGWIVKKNKKEEIQYGNGMRFGKIGGLETIFHKGFINGSSNIFVYDEKSDIFVVILSNTSSVLTDNLAGYVLKKSLYNY